MCEVRITRSFNEMVGLEFMFPKSVWYEEGGKDGKKVHLHGYVEAYTSQTIRRKLREEYGLKGNEDYKVSNVKDYDSYIAYMSKDGNQKYSGLKIDFTQYKWVDLKKGSILDKIFKGAEKGCDVSYYVRWCVEYMLENNKLVNRRMIEIYVTSYLARTDSSFKSSLVSSISFNITRA